MACWRCCERNDYKCNYPGLTPPVWLSYHPFQRKDRCRANEIELRMLGGNVVNIDESIFHVGGPTPEDYRRGAVVAENGGHMVFVHGEWQVYSAPVYHGKRIVGVLFGKRRVDPNYTFNPPESVAPKTASLQKSNPGLKSS